MLNLSATSKAIIPALLLAFVAGCDEEKAGGGAPSASASVAAAPSAAPSAVAPVPPPPPPPPAAPAHACPPDSEGDGTLAKPCDAKNAAARMMEVTWNGKYDEVGPQFRVLNKGKETILYGKVYVYFYDKAGKQLEVKDSEGKTHQNKLCFGNIFSGVMKPNEKAVIAFSCVKKDAVPEGTVAIEAEMGTVGFADASGAKSEYYWRNPELNPEVRPKGGVKKK